MIILGKIYFTSNGKWYYKLTIYNERLQVVIVQLRCDSQRNNKKNIIMYDLIT
jgi:hypothetical protein